MSRPLFGSDRFRNMGAALLLVVAGVFTLVALSQLFFGGAADPRDSLGSRAAGFGFTDRAHDTLYGVIPLGLPLAAAWLAPRRPFRLLAAVAYVVLIGTGLMITGMAFGFGLDVAEQQQNMGVGVFIDPRFAVERFVLDISFLALAALAMIAVVRADRRDRAAATRLRSCTTVRH
ncbi:MAG TPA: hypothetical protein H9881_11100 [Candidatus Stackebrandtia excrementipullorum]|nr:hypothetical protein [Candidatus Stackebrandtia excrementipullorum]